LPVFDSSRVIEAMICRAAAITPVLFSLSSAAAPAGVLMPAPGPFSGTYTLLVDESGQQASWTLELCDTPAYVASHLHTVSHILCKRRRSKFNGWPTVVQKFTV
jgi:hypothetical protein